jgi:hypothetical protein
MFKIIVKNYYKDEKDKDEIIEEYSSYNRLEYNFMDVYITKDNKKYLTINTKFDNDKNEVTIYVAKKT